MSKSIFVAFLATEFALLLMAYQGKIYDMATGAGFALALGLLQRKRFTAYYFLFPLLALNRETTILLVLFYGIWFGFQSGNCYSRGAVKPL